MYPADVESIEAVAADYIEGWYHGDTARMDRALHPDLVKRMIVRDEETGEDTFRMVTKERMMAMTADGGGEDPDPAYEVTVNHISDSIATAHVLSPEYLDLLHLARTNEGWKIANVLFRVR